MIKTSEFGFIAQIQKQFSSSPNSLVSLGIGDDAAAFMPSQGYHSLLTTDTLIENIHFSRNYSTFEQIGIKAVSVNLSDIAAMGGCPRTFLVSLGVPDHIHLSDLKKLYRGIAKTSHPINLALIGGNTTRTSGPFFISITLHGEVLKKQMVTRSGAKVGDALYTTGTLGDAAAGLAYLKKPGEKKGMRYLLRSHQTPQARTEEGQLIAKAGIASAMIDLSDGLSADLNHLITQSGVGVVLNLAQIPLSPALKRYAKQNKVKALDFALFGGDDYELLFSVPPNKEKKLAQLVENGLIQATRIGTIGSKKEGIRVKDSDGNTQLITPKGYDHFLHTGKTNNKNKTEENSD